jgi:hypothetical protein
LSGTIAAPQVRAAVWHSLIAGARGIVYFDHSFGGPCVTLHSLRSPCYSEVNETVLITNQQIAELAPFLNSGDVVGLTNASPQVATVTKRLGSDVLILAGSRDGTDSLATFRVGCPIDGSVEVVGEGRTLEPSDGVIQDRFEDADSVHLYRFAVGGRCG